MKKRGVREIVDEQVPVGTTMRPGSGLMIGKEESVVVVVVVVMVMGVVDSIDGSHKAWGCVIY